MSIQYRDSYNMDDQQQVSTRREAHDAGGDERSYPVDYGDPEIALSAGENQRGAGTRDRADDARRARRMQAGPINAGGPQTFEFKTPDSGRGEGPAKTVVLVEPTPDVLDLCFEMASDHQKRGTTSYMYQAQLNQIRMCLKHFGGVDLTFEDLQGDGLSAHVTVYEMQYILKGLEKLTTPPNAKVERFLDSMTLQPR